MTPSLTVIGTVHPNIRGFEIRVSTPFRSGLNGLAGFSHAIICWYADRAGPFQTENNLICRTPYTSTDADFGIFATRTPERPSPIGLSVVEIAGIDEQKGCLHTPFMDALPNTPVLDIKPYFPASDRVERASVPDHFSHWPVSFEQSMKYDWSREFR